MKGIENIVKAILDDANADVKTTKDQTEKQIQQMKNKVNAETDKQSASLKKETIKKAEELKRREKTILEVEIRRNNLKVKREMVDKAFEMALVSLCELEDSEYKDIIKNMMLSAAESGCEEVVPSTDKRVDEKLIDEVNQELKSQKRTGELTLSNDIGDFVGGFILRENGIETNCTFHMLINQIKPKFESEVANILFG